MRWRVPGIVFLFYFVTFSLCAGGDDVFAHAKSPVNILAATRPYFSSFKSSVHIVVKLDIDTFSPR